MNDDLEDACDHAQDEVTKESVEARVRDWVNRLDTLYAQIRGWGTGNGWQVDESGTVTMHEELMQKFGVPATTQPIIRLDSDRGYALFKPKGLWVIGANGRIDLFTPKGAFIIVDLAKFGSAPEWTIFRVSGRRQGQPFTTDLIEELI